MARAAIRDMARACVAWLGAVGGVAWAIAEEPRADLARFVPARGLTASVEYDGLDAHDAAWRRTVAHQILAETSAGRVIAESARQAFDRLQQLVPGNPLAGSTVVAVRPGPAHPARLRLRRDPRSATSYVVAVTLDLRGAAAVDRLRGLLLSLSPGEQPPTFARAKSRSRRSRLPNCAEGPDAKR